MDKMWAGRFSKELSKITNDFNSSISFDFRMFEEDVTGSIAHAEMLGKTGIITAGESAEIVAALKQLLSDVSSGKTVADKDSEDVHMFVEKVLTERIGEAGKKLHTARSRNDQVALDLRMYAKNQIKIIKKDVVGLISALASLAKEHTGTLMCGYTHLQKAQPVTLAHYFLAYASMFIRDCKRLDDAYDCADVMPLGSLALAGTTYPIDRGFIARKLGFKNISVNSIDGVSDRDFVLELAFALSVVMMHLSRFSEEVILWCSNEFGYLELDDAYATGSSIMPQKKNPDIAELVRGKTGRVYGGLTALLTVMKGLPLAYNKDMQEDKESLFDCIDTVKMCLPVFTDMLVSAKFNKEKLAKSLESGFVNATDCADYLTKKGVPFRSAYRTTGEIVAYCIKNSKTLNTLSLQEYAAFSDKFAEDIYAAVDLKNCVEKRSSFGGPSSESVKEQIKTVEEFLKND